MNEAARAGLLAVIAVGAALLLLPRSQPIAPIAPDEDHAGSAPAVRDDSAASSSRSGARGFSAPRSDEAARDSLAGTDVAGALLVDADGNFYPSAEAVELFDYFLSTVGETTLDDAVARIREEIRRRLSPPADAQALAFLDRYLLYRERGIALAATEAGDEDLRARFDRLRALRREVFGEEVAARLFGDEEAVAEVAIRQREVALDPDLTEAEKAKRIEDLYGELPEPMREARARALAATTLRADEERIRSEGGTEEDIRALRVERFGDEAADRLEALDRRRAEWDSRLDAFRSERARILGDSTLSEQERRTAIARLLQDSFDEGERTRIEALDRIASETGSRD